MRNFLYRIASGIRRFMTGRYGSDQLNFALIISAIAFDILNLILRRFTGFLPIAIIASVFSILSTAAVILTIVRMFSKNIGKRYEENQKFLKIWDQVKMLPKFHIYRCKNCKQKIRVPRKGGKRVEIRCPKCGQTFIKRI